MSSSRRFIVAFMTIMLFTSQYAFANSSWHWVTMSPFKVLPLAIILTFIVEISMVKWFNKEVLLVDVVRIITIANILSFLVPYISRAQQFAPVTGGFDIMSAFDKGPYYIVLTGYLLITLLIEVPFCFYYLKRNSEKPLKLFGTIFIANVMTTGIVAVLERTLCVGQW